MEIEHKSKATVTFQNLCGGACFMHGTGAVFMKLKTTSSNAVDLDDGCCIYISPETLVAPIRVKAVVQ
jgi:hypothetical protein